MIFKAIVHFLKPISFPLLVYKAFKAEYIYEMPEVLKQSFFLANASYYNQMNWFVHRTYEVAFCDLIKEVKVRQSSFDNVKAVETVLNFIKVMEPCNVVLDLRYAIEREGGDLSVVRGFRVQHGRYRDNIPCLGGLTISTKISKDMMKALSVLATYKYALFGIDMNGSHGGIKICKSEYTEEEHKVIIQKYILELVNKGSFGENVDIIEPDVNCGYEEMVWISESKIKSLDKSTIIRSIVGKPNFCRGIENYEKAGPHCIFILLDYFLNHKTILKNIQCEAGLKNKSFIIQGIGKLGSQIALLLENFGAKCVGVKEHDAYVYDKRGICVKDIVDYKYRKSGIEHFNTKTKPRQDNEILTEECDILVLCAEMKTVDCYTAEKVKAKIVIEAANGAITPSAHQILLGHRRLVLPDLLVTCGFCLAAYYEYLKNAQFINNVLLNRSLTKDIYKDLLYNAESKRKAEIVGSSTHLDYDNGFKESKVVFDAMEYIIGQICREVLKNVEKYNLGLDIRTAAYIKATHDLFIAFCESRQKAAK